MKNSNNHTNGFRKGLNQKLTFAAAALLLSGAAFEANAQVTMTDVGATAPSAGSDGISQLDSSGTLNGQIDYSDKNTGQSFTLGSAASYNLNSISLKLNPDFGGSPDPFLNPWTIEVASFDNVGSWTGGFGGRTDTTSPPYGSAYLNNTSMGTGTMNWVAFSTGSTGLGSDPVAGDWITFTFAAPITLSGNASYAFEVSSSVPWAGFDVSSSDVYSGGFDFNSWGAAGANNNYVRNNTTVDKTFVANLTAAPEPSVAALGGLGCLALCYARRRRS